MREKPVPVRVDKEFRPDDVSAPMEEVKDVTEEENEVNVCEEQQDITSKELPSMVSIVPLNKPHVFDVHNIGMFQQTFQLKPRFENPEEFEFLEKESVSESQKQAVKFGVRVFRGKDIFTCWVLRCHIYRHFGTVRQIWELKIHFPLKVRA